MTKEKIAKLRTLLTIQDFIPWNKWNNSLKSNCIAYALGFQLDDKNGFFNYLFSDDDPIIDLREILKIMNFPFRELSSSNEKEEDEIVIVLYHYIYDEMITGYDYEHLPYSYPTGRKIHEVHLARIEKDGTWTHKHGWDYPTSITSSKEITSTIEKEDGVKNVVPSAFFAIRKPR